MRFYDIGESPLMGHSEKHIAPLLLGGIIAAGASLAGCVLAVECFPVVPNQSVRYEEKVNVQVGVVHDREDRRTSPYNGRGFHFEGIPR